jgi:hypothetical protein
MAARQVGGGAPRRRWPQYPTLNPWWAPPCYPDPNASSNTQRGWPRGLGHGEPSRGRTPTRSCGGGIGNVALPWCVWGQGWDEGVEGLKADLVAHLETWWHGGEHSWARWSGRRQWRLRFLCQEGERGGRKEGMGAAAAPVASLRESWTDWWGHGRRMATTTRPRVGVGLWPVGHTELTELNLDWIDGRDDRLTAGFARSISPKLARFRSWCYWQNWRAIWRLQSCQLELGLVQLS